MLNLKVGHDRKKSCISPPSSSYTTDDITSKRDLFPPRSLCMSNVYESVPLYMWKATQSIYGWLGRMRVFSESGGRKIERESEKRGERERGMRERERER